MAGDQKIGEENKSFSVMTNAKSPKLESCKALLLYFIESNIDMHMKHKTQIQ